MLIARLSIGAERARQQCSAQLSEIDLYPGCSGKKVVGRVTKQQSTAQFDRDRLESAKTLLGYIS